MSLYIFFNDNKVCKLFKLEYLLKSFCRSKIIIIYYTLTPQGSGWIIGIVDSLEISSTALGGGVEPQRDISSKLQLDCQDFFFLSTSFYLYSFLLAVFLCFLVLFQSYCSHAEVFGRALVHEFPIFYSHTEWSLLFCSTKTGYGSSVLFN